MKTRCPNCQTSFRITPEQLKARVGKVRCGQCQNVFNALDSLLDEAPAAPPGALHGVGAQPPVVHIVQEAANEPMPTIVLGEERNEPTLAAPPTTTAEEIAEPTVALSEAETIELGKASGLIMPRETTAIPGYSKWVEEMVSMPLAPPAAAASRWPFILAALLLVLALGGQLLFHFRSEVAVAAPRLRPLLATLSQAVGAALPLPRHVELVSIETSDLQSDPTRGNLLVLSATLRNRAAYGQDYPALELALTDTQDAAIARRVFSPAEYLSPQTANREAFAANSEIAVRLWIEARETVAAGYRLYVFYP